MSPEPSFPLAMDGDFRPWMGFLVRRIFKVIV
jgi:hypothetical protein